MGYFLSPDRFRVREKEANQKKGTETFLCVCEALKLILTETPYEISLIFI